MSDKIDIDFLLLNIMDAANECRNLVVLIEAVVPFLDNMPAKTPDIDKVDWLINKFLEMQPKKLDYIDEALEMLRHSLKE